MRDLGPGELVFWKGLGLLRKFECPNCGLEAKDMHNFTTLPMKCPICKTQWERVAPFDQAQHLTGGG
jgi:predicted Zn-ribbon and HTH transcriptional regulator